MSQASGATNNRILIVDDDPQFRVELKEYLTDHGFRVGTAGDGKGMRMRMEESAYDLVIMDLTLPGEDGLALTQCIRRHSPIPVVMLTAKEETVDRVIGLESGAADYITKPFEPRELVARIRSVLRRASPPAETEVEKPGAVVKFEGRKPARRSSRPAPIDRDRQHPKAKLPGGTNAPTRVIGPSGKPLTIEDLPPPDTRCWVIRRKAEVVAAVRGGLLSE
ncbi:MAG: response regulator, partial [Proteobacteria bacterium]|nr:response regulator [Pseudomonadota bacterium]